MSEKKSLVLVVDDIQSNVEFIVDILASVDSIEVEGVYDGESTFEFIEKRRPNLILLDISMPVMDGFEVCQRLKGDKRYADIPIIFLTARVQKEDIVKGFEYGAIDYISKPFNLSELLSRVKTHLDLGRKTEELQEINANLEVIVANRTKQLQDANTELSKVNDKLSKMYDELSALDYAKNDFIAHINHELRTPLNGIIGYSSLLEELVQSDGKKHLNSINMLVSRLVKVSEISLLLTELRTVDDKINIRKVSLSNAIENAQFRDEMEKKNIHIIQENITKEIQILAEPRLLSICISIILDNSIKYSPINGNIHLRGRDNQSFFTLDISDEGPGFSSIALSSIFELFSADNLEYRSHGFGIGLATAKRIIDLLGGKINIKNSPKGASVALHLKKA